MKRAHAAAFLVGVLALSCTEKKVDHTGHHHAHGGEEGAAPGADDHGAAKPGGAAKDEHGHDHGEHKDEKPGAHAVEKPGAHAGEKPGAHAGEGAHAEEEGEIHLSEVALAQNGIRVEAAQGGALGGGVDVPAQVAPNPTKVVHVTLPVSGRVTEAKVALGDMVQKGAVLASVESAELGEAQSAIGQARADVDVAKKNYERQKELVESGIGARRNFEEAEATLKRSEAALSGAVQKTRVYGGGETVGSTIVLKAPLAGQIIERHGNVGEVVDPNEPLFVVADLSQVWIEGRVSEQDAGKAVVGAKATLTLQAYPGQAFEGTLSFVGPVVDPQSRAVPVRMELKNEGGKLKPGLFGTLSISPIQADGGSVLQRALLPQDAVQRTQQGDVVFVPGDEKGAFKSVPVAVGAKKDGRVEILNGVKPGDLVVTVGAFVLKSEMMKGELGEGHAH